MYDPHLLAPRSALLSNPYAAECGGWACGFSVAMTTGIVYLKLGRITLNLLEFSFIVERLGAKARP
jgi:hypothetical protein